MSDNVHSSDQGPDAGIGVHDARTMWRCPQLGGPVTFGYCRRCNQTLPCGKVTTCWAGRLDVESFLNTHYSPEEVARVDAGNRGRMDIVSETLLRVLNTDREPSNETL